MAISRRRRRVAALGDREFLAIGVRSHLWEDLYHRAVTVSWPRFFGAGISVFLLFNLLFALIYQLHPHGIANEDPRGLAGAFFFSVETLSTVGYGYMHPQSLYAHSVATVEMMFGIGNIAVLTGLIFKRFSRSRARIIFSKYAIVRPIDGKPTLMMRAANIRLNLIAQADAHLHLIRLHTTREGFQLRRIENLKLVRHRHPMFVLGWTVMHVIDEESPLHGTTPQELKASEATLLLTIEGVDENTSQPLIANCQWDIGDVRWNHRFIDLVHRDSTGADVIDYAHFDEVMPLEGGNPPSA